MSAITGPFPHGHGDTAQPAHSGDAGKPDNYLTHGKGLSSWIFTLDHKRIGLHVHDRRPHALRLRRILRRRLANHALEPGGPFAADGSVNAAANESTTSTTTFSPCTAR